MLAEKNSMQREPLEGAVVERDAVVFCLVSYESAALRNHPCFIRGFSPGLNYKQGCWWLV